MADRITANPPSRDFTATLALSTSPDATLRGFRVFKQPDAPRRVTPGDPGGSLLAVLDNRDRT